MRCDLMKTFGRGILADIRHPILYRVMCFVQWACAEINQWVIIRDIYIREIESWEILSLSYKIAPNRRLKGKSHIRLLENATNTKQQHQVKFQTLLKGKKRYIQLNFKSIQTLIVRLALVTCVTTTHVAYFMCGFGALDGYLIHDKSLWDRV